MLLWRLSTRQHANSFDGGYGLLFAGRWNSVGNAVTYSATSPSLCVLEKLVHIEDPALLPELIMLIYDAPDTVASETIPLAKLPPDWRRQEGWTQRTGDAWHRARTAALLFVPSVIVPLSASPDVNVLINHSHPSSAQIRQRSAEPYALDPRLF